jgi:hypothetical protein
LEQSSWIVPAQKLPLMTQGQIGFAPHDAGSIRHSRVSIMVHPETPLLVQASMPLAHPPPSTPAHGPFGVTRQNCPLLQDDAPQGVVSVEASKGTDASAETSASPPDAAPSMPLPDEQAAASSKIAQPGMRTICPYTTPGRQGQARTLVAAQHGDRADVAVQQT